MLKVIIVDDDSNVIDALSLSIQNGHPDFKICATCTSLKAAIEAIGTHEPDLVLLDIEIGKDNGFEIFRHFPDPRFKVIFITGHDQYAIQAFRFSAFDYLLKPVSPALFKEVLNKAAEKTDFEKMALKIDSLLSNTNQALKRNKKIVLRTAENIHLVKLSDILYCEADGGYTTFYLADNSRIIVSHAMGDYEELFDDYGFFRIHNSYLLNLAHFKRFEKTDGGRAVLKNDSWLPVASRKKDSFLLRLASL